MGNTFYRPPQRRVLQDIPEPFLGVSLARREGLGEAVSWGGGRVAGRRARERRRSSQAAMA